jgi:predicted AlkP superfamily pyrophosphatase or phosphodiesterase
VLQKGIALTSRTKFTILVVLEAFRADTLTAEWDLLSSTGLRRLIGGSAYFPRCRNLASTFSASSLATLSTGTWPALHGIVADRWYDRALHRPVGASEEALLATTLTSQVAASPHMRAFVIGMNPVHTRLFGGSPRANLYWMDDGGQFATRGPNPDWLEAYNRHKPIENLRDTRWLALGSRPDAPPLRTLAYSPERPQEFVSLYKASPFSQMAQFEFLGELLQREKIGQGPTSDFVCLLLGSTAQLGYETGAVSPLMQQMTLHLDRHIEYLLTQLDRLLGEDEYSVVLTAAHGIPPAPAPESRSRMAVDGEALAAAVQRELATTARVEKYMYPFMYLEGGAPIRDIETSRRAAGRAAMNLPPVSTYFTAGGACPLSGEWEERLHNSFHPQRSGDLMLSYRPEYVEEYGAGRGISYGSLYNYDATVPLALFGPQFRPGTYERCLSTVDVVPTLARVLGVAEPSSSIGTVAGEAFAEVVKSKE